MRVLDMLTRLFCEKYACDPEDVTMDATLDELNIAPHEREDMALLLCDAYGVERDDDVPFAFDTVEDVVGFVEDRICERGESL